MSIKLEFIPLNIEQNRDLILKNRAYGFYSSFGSEDSFWESDGKGGERYLDWLVKQDQKKFFAFHVLSDQKIIGQLEIGVFKPDESWGYINYFYLNDENRGKGLASQLHDFVIEHFRHRGLSKAKLSVAPDNTPAYKFYEKHGWVDKGPREYLDRNGVALSHIIHIMELEF
jgi:ribosomal protein S18 acetylase RimI-like enzyme